jgi:hypothetical protein
MASWGPTVMYVPSPVIVATGGIGNWSMGGIAWDAVARSQYVSASGEGWGARDAEDAAVDAGGAVDPHATGIVAARTTRAVRRNDRRMRNPPVTATRP